MAVLIVAFDEEEPELASFDSPSRAPPVALLGVVLVGAAVEVVRLPEVVVVLGVVAVLGVVVPVDVVVVAGVVLVVVVVGAAAGAPAVGAVPVGAPAYAASVAIGE